jgi:hypothetical protein
MPRYESNLQGYLDQTGGGTAASGYFAYNLDKSIIEERQKQKRSAAKKDMTNHRPFAYCQSSQIQ